MCVCLSVFVRVSEFIPSSEFPLLFDSLKLKYLLKTTKRGSLRPGDVCVYLSACSENVLLPQRTGYFIMFKQITEKVQDVI